MRNGYSDPNNGSGSSTLAMPGAPVFATSPDFLDRSVFEISQSLASISLELAVLQEIQLRVRLLMQTRQIGLMRLQQMLQAVRLARGGIPGDGEIEMLLTEMIGAYPPAAVADIEIEASNHEVTLAGVAPNAYTKRFIEMIAWQIPGVADVHNAIEIKVRRAGGTL